MSENGSLKGKRRKNGVSKHRRAGGVVEGDAEEGLLSSAQHHAQRREARRLRRARSRSRTRDVRRQGVSQRVKSASKTRHGLVKSARDSVKEVPMSPASDLNGGGRRVDALVHDVSGLSEWDEHAHVQAGQLSVSVRVRPFVQEDGEHPCSLDVDNGLLYLQHHEDPDTWHEFDVVRQQMLLWRVPPEEVQTVDGVVPVSLHEEFARTGEPLVDAAFTGLDAALVVYGGHRSGKTHALYGKRQVADSESPGIVGLLCNALLHEARAAATSFAGHDKRVLYSIRLSYVEVAGERVFDLLSEPPQQGTKERPLRLKERGDRVFPTKQVKAELHHYDDLVTQLQHARRRSRQLHKSLSTHPVYGHRVLTFHVGQTLVSDAQHLSAGDAEIASSETTISVFELGPGTDRDEQDERRLNTSVGAFHDMMDAVSDLGHATKRKAAGAPVADFDASVLTLLLKHAVVGSVRTTFLATVSPSSVEYPTSLETLTLAQRVSRINLQELRKEAHMREQALRHPDEPPVKLDVPEPVETWVEQSASSPVATLQSASEATESESEDSTSSSSSSDSSSDTDTTLSSAPSDGWMARESEARARVRSRLLRGSVAKLNAQARQLREQLSELDERSDRLRDQERAKREVARQSASRLRASLQRAQRAEDIAAECFKAVLAARHDLEVGMGLLTAQEMNEVLQAQRSKHLQPELTKYDGTAGRSHRKFLVSSLAEFWDDDTHQSADVRDKRQQRTLERGVPDHMRDEALDTSSDTDSAKNGARTPSPEPLPHLSRTEVHRRAMDTKRTPSKALRMLGASEQQFRRRKALRVLGISEAEFNALTPDFKARLLNSGSSGGADAAAPQRGRHRRSSSASRAPRLAVVPNAAAALARADSAALNGDEEDTDVPGAAPPGSLVTPKIMRARSLSRSSRVAMSEPSSPVGSPPPLQIELARVLHRDAGREANQRGAQSARRPDSDKGSAAGPAEDEEAARAHAARDFVTHGQPGLPDEALSPRSRRRAEVYAELLESEAQYAADLETLLEQFVRPVMLHREQFGMSKEELRSLFCNIESIANLHQLIYHDVAAAFARLSHDPLAVIETYEKNAPFLRMYLDFVSSYDIAIDTRHMLMDKNERFREFMKQVRRSRRKETQGRRLEDFMIMPVQRLPKVDLLLNRLRKYLPIDSPEVTAIDRVIELVRSIAQEVNEKKRHGENIAELMNLHPRVRRLVAKIMRPHRFVMLHGQLEQTVVDKLVPLYFILFNDCLVWCAASSYQYQDMVKLAHATVHSDSMHPTEFVVSSHRDDHILHLHAKTRLERKQWVAALEEGVYLMQLREKNERAAAASLDDETAEDSAHVELLRTRAGRRAKERQHNRQRSKTPNPRVRRRANIGNVEHLHHAKTRTSGLFRQRKADDGDEQRNEELEHSAWSASDMDESEHPPPKHERSDSQWLSVPGGRGRKGDEASKGDEAPKDDDNDNHQEQVSGDERGGSFSFSSPNPSLPPSPRLGSAQPRHLYNQELHRQYMQDYEEFRRKLNE